MDRWPQELFDHVVLFTEQRVGEDTVPVWEHQRLPPARPILAVVSRKFQAAVERLTFEELRVKASDSGLDDLARILNARRRQSLRGLSVTLILPPLYIDEFREFWWMTDEDRRANNNATTALLRRLFDILNRNPAAPAIELEIAGAEPTPDARGFPSASIHTEACL
ncbi:hypothetical protein GGR58DRAFT_522679 [Xylaria digitata]|nr:hypothetical protein GGR58DRAFT_522679 [Xylaria digitata]